MKKKKRRKSIWPKKKKNFSKEKHLPLNEKNLANEKYIILFSIHHKLKIKEKKKKKNQNEKRFAWSIQAIKMFTHFSI